MVCIQHRPLLAFDAFARLAQRFVFSDSLLELQYFDTFRAAENDFYFGYFHDSRIMLTGHIGKSVLVLLGLFLSALR